MKPSEQQEHLETLLQIIQAHRERERDNRNLNDFQEMFGNAINPMEQRTKTGLYTYFQPVHQPLIDKYGYIAQNEPKKCKGCGKSIAYGMYCDRCTGLT